MAHGREQEELWESQQKNILNHSVDGLFLTMYGLRLQPQQGGCLHLGLMTTWLAMNRPQLGWGVIITMNVKFCSVHRDSQYFDQLIHWHSAQHCNNGSGYSRYSRISGECWTFGSEATECRFFKKYSFCQNMEVCIGNSVIHWRKQKLQHLHLSTWLKTNKQGSHTY